MACKQEATVVTMLVAVCEKALADLDSGDRELAPLVTQLEKTRKCALDAARTFGSCDDARVA